MPVFDVVSKDTHNHYVKERLSAPTVKDARTMLRERGYMPMEIKEISRMTLMVEAFKAAVAKAGPTDEEKAREADKAKKKAEVDELKAKMAGSKFYYYEGINDDTAEECVGIVKAQSFKDARAQLREKRMIPKVIRRDLFGQFKFNKDDSPKVKKEKNFDQSSFERMVEKIFPPKVTQKDLTLMAQQLAAITQAGLPILAALGLLRDTIANRYLQKIVTEMIEQISQGVSFGETIKEYNDVFPALFIELVEMGETTGNLDENMKRLGDYMAKQLELQQKVKGAMTYPLIVLGILVLIVIGLMIFIVPTFMRLFEEFKVELVQKYIDYIRNDEDVRPVLQLRALRLACAVQAIVEAGEKSRPQRSDDLTYSARFTSAGAP